MDREKSSIGFDRIQQLQLQLEELKKSWPAHSVSASMFQQLEELEEELAQELSQSESGS